MTTLAQVERGRDRHAVLRRFCALAQDNTTFEILRFLVGESPFENQAALARALGISRQWVSELLDKHRDKIAVLLSENDPLPDNPATKPKGAIG